MTPAERLKEIEERLKKATPGPWAAVSDLPFYAVAAKGSKDVVPSENRRYNAWDRNHLGAEDRDANFIAHAPEDVAWLIERVRDYMDDTPNWHAERERHEKRIAKLEAALQGMLESYQLAENNLPARVSEVIAGYFLTEVQSAREALKEDE